MALLSFFIAIFVSLTANTLIKQANLILALLILVGIILLGIIFDMVGSAVLSAKEAPFHAMGAKRVAGSKQSIALIKNADKVATFCNDVVGDIAGTVAGAAGAIIVIRLLQIYPLGESSLGILMTALIAALTIGGKSMSKTIACKNWLFIINMAGKVFYWLEKQTGLTILNSKKNCRKRV